MSRAAAKQSQPAAKAATAPMRAAAPKRSSAADAVRNLQRSAGNRAARSALASLPGPVSRLLGSSVGEPLAPELRASMEQKLGADLRGVRVHRDSRSAESAESVDARAYTVGSDVVFNRGEFSPASEGGRKLLAHELAHVVQQSRGGRELEGSHGAAMEQSAERAATASGPAAGVGGGSAVGLARARKTKNPLFMPKETVDMPWGPNVSRDKTGKRRSKSSALGFKRDAPWFWRRWRDAHRAKGALSPQNIQRINKGLAPKVDADWVKVYPQHSSYMGETLHHHHAGHGGTATPMPQTLHKAAGDKVFHADKKPVGPGQKPPDKPDIKSRKAAVKGATNQGQLPRSGKGGAQRMPKVSPGSEVAALPRSKQGRAKIDTSNVDPKTGAATKQGAGAKGAGVKSSATPGPAPAAKSAPAPEAPKPAPGPEAPKAPAQKPAPAPAAEVPKPAPPAAAAEPHVAPPSAPHPQPSIKPTPQAPEAKVELTPPSKSGVPEPHVSPPAPAPAAPHADPHVSPPHGTPKVAAPHVPSPHIPRVPTKGLSGALGKLKVAGKFVGPGVAVGMGAYGTYKDITEGKQDVPEALLGNAAQTGVNLTSIGGPADAVINLANAGLQFSGADRETKEKGNLLADVTPSTFGGNAAKQLARGLYNIAKGDDKAIDKQVKDINEGAAGKPLQGYSLWFTKIGPELASGKDPLEVFNESAAMINNKTLEKAGNYLGDQAYQVVNKDLPEFVEFAGKDIDRVKTAAKEEWESAKGEVSDKVKSAKGAANKAWNYLTGD